MPTSSITERIRINNPKPLEELVAHMEESSKHFYEKSCLIQTSALIQKEWTLL